MARFTTFLIFLPKQDFLTRKENQLKKDYTLKKNIPIEKDSTFYNEILESSKYITMYLIENVNIKDFTPSLTK